MTRVLVWLKGTPFLIQLISGGGIPVAEQVKTTDSVSFTVYVKSISRGKVMLGMTGRNQEANVINQREKDRTYVPSGLLLYRYTVKYMNCRYCTPLFNRFTKMVTCMKISYALPE